MGLERMELDGLWDRVSLEYYLGIFIFEILCKVKFYYFNIKILKSKIQVF